MGISKPSLQFSMPSMIVSSTSNENLFLGGHASGFINDMKLLCLGFCFLYVFCCSELNLCVNLLKSIQFSGCGIYEERCGCSDP